MGNRQGLLMLHREFLPSMEGRINDDSVYFSISANAVRIPQGDNTKIYLHWGCHFNIRSDSTRITLHAADGDAGLIKTEAKLMLLRDTLVFFCAEVRKRMKEPGLEKLSKRIWLNEEDDAHYTGYCFYEILPDGSSRFYIADCHRVLNFHLEVYHKSKISPRQSRWVDLDNKFTKAQLRRFDAFVKNLNLCLDKIAKLREAVQAGKLGVDVGTDGWSTGTDTGAVSA